MTRQLLRISVIGLTIALSAGLCFAEDTFYKFRLPEKDEPIYGTWINKKYPGTLDYAQKWVYYGWAYGEAFKLISDTTPASRNSFILVEKWQDAKGNTWYKELDILPNGTRFFCLDRIGKDGKVFEEVWDFKDFPNESDMNSKNETYHIYYRE